MALTQGLIDSYWRKYNQRRALTGLPSSYQETRGTLDPILEYDAKVKQDEARRIADNKYRERSLSITEQAQKDAARAATVSGIAQTGGLLATGLLTNKALNNQAANTEIMRQYIIGGQGVGSGGLQLPQGVGSAALTQPGALQMPQATAPMLQTPTTFAAGAGDAAIPAAAPSTLEALGGAGLSGLGMAAGAYGANVALGKALQPSMDKSGYHYTGKYGTYGGLPGAATGLTIDIGKKVVDEIGHFASDVFGW